MDEQPQGPLPQARWSLEHAVAVLHQNGLKLKPHTLSKFEGGIEFEVYSVQDSYGQSIVLKYPSERWVYNDNDYGIDRFQLLRQEYDLLRFTKGLGIPAPEVIAYFVRSPYQAKAGRQTVTGRRRMRVAPAGMRLAVS